MSFRKDKPSNIVSQMVYHGNTYDATIDGKIICEKRFGHKERKVLSSITSYNIYELLDKLDFQFYYDGYEDSYAYAGKAYPNMYVDFVSKIFEFFYEIPDGRAEMLKLCEPIMLNIYEGEYMSIVDFEKKYASGDVDGCKRRWKKSRMYRYIELIKKDGQRGKWQKILRYYHKLSPALQNSLDMTEVLTEIKRLAVQDGN